MKKFAFGAALATLLLSAAPSSAATVTAANLSARCATDIHVCEKAIRWLRDNTSACFRTNVPDAVVTAKVVAWLESHPRQTGKDDAEVVSFAVDDLWPCQ